MTQVRWRDLDEQYRDRLRAVGLINGCGPEGRVPCWILSAMRAVLPDYYPEWCDQHDFNYLVGHTEADRIKADWQFYEVLRASSDKASWWRRPWHRWLAWLAYQAVRRWGAESFYYGAEERSLEDLGRLLEEREAAA